MSVLKSLWDKCLFMSLVLQGHLENFPFNVFITYLSLLWLNYCVFLNKKPLLYQLIKRGEISWLKAGMLNKNKTLLYYCFYSQFILKMFATIVSIWREGVNRYLATVRRVYFDYNYWTLMKSEPAVRKTHKVTQ